MEDIPSRNSSWHDDLVPLLEFLLSDDSNLEYATLVSKIKDMMKYTFSHDLIMYNKSYSAWPEPLRDQMQSLIMPRTLTSLAELQKKLLVAVRVYSEYQTELPVQLS